MSRMIKIENSFLDKVKEEFLKMLEKGNFKDNTISFKQKIVGNTNEKADVFIEDKAYQKMFALVDHFSTEIAWHCLAKRDDKGKYTISDVIVYPQKVTGATVNTDQEKYQMWLFELPDEVFPLVRCQAHSHVNMATSPSGTDTNYYDQIVETLGDEDFFIFMILNKRRDIFCNIYDKKYNVMYESKDITITKTYDDEIEELLKDAHEKCKEEVKVIERKYDRDYFGSSYDYNGYYAAKYGKDAEKDEELEAELKRLEKLYEPETGKKKIKVKGSVEDTVKMGRTGWSMHEIYGIDDETYASILNDPFGYM